MHFKLENSLEKHMEPIGHIKRKNRLYIYLKHPKFEK